MHWEVWLWHEISRLKLTLVRKLSVAYIFLFLFLPCVSIVWIPPFFMHDKIFTYAQKAGMFMTFVLVIFFWVIWFCKLIMFLKTINEFLIHLLSFLLSKLFWKQKQSTLNERFFLQYRILTGILRDFISSFESKYLLHR